MKKYITFLILAITSFPTLSQEQCKSSVLTGTVEAVKMSQAKDERAKEGGLTYHIKIRREIVNSDTNNVNFSYSPWLTVLSNGTSTAPSVLPNATVSAFYSQHPVKVTCDDDGVINEIILSQTLDALE